MAPLNGNTEQKDAEKHGVQLPQGYKWAALARAAAAGAVVLYGALMMWMLVLLLDQQDANQREVQDAAEQREQLLRLVQQVESCTTPEGECFRESAERQASIIGEPAGPINSVVVAATACAVTLGEDATFESVRECTEETLEGNSNP